jgi:hypothetical protein
MSRERKEAAVMMHGIRRFSTYLLLSILAIGFQAALAQARLQNIQSSQGGTIVYGSVDGVSTKPAALVAMLRMVHQTCAERPQVAQVFKVPGGDAVGLFFTVVNRAQGGNHVGGMIVAAASGPQQVEVAMIANTIDRFNAAMSPMLRELFGAWHPSGLPAASTYASTAHTTADANPAPVSTAKTGLAGASAKSVKDVPVDGGHYAPAAKLHTVSASDNSVSIGIPDGWQLDSQSAGGAVRVLGPQGETIGLNMTRTAIDPTSPGQRQLQRYGVRGAAPGVMSYPFRGDMVHSFPALFQEWRRAGGMPSAELQIDKIDQVDAQQGEHCAQVDGHLDPHGNEMHMSSMMCAFDPGQAGFYIVVFNNALIPTTVFDKDHLTAVAMIETFKLNMEVINQQMAAAAQQKEQNDRMIMQNAQQQVDRIHAIGAQATARYNANQAANDAQHASYWAQQDSNARNGQGFSNYQRDQTVVRDAQDPNVHATVSNQTAGWMQQAFPNRVEEVPASQYIAGQDY